MSWWIAVASFVGALVGAAIPAWVALRGQHQDARSEWRQRLDRAIDLTSSSQEGQRLIGDELLGDLIRSDLGTDADRDLARRIAQLRVDQEVDDGSAGVDPAQAVRDNRSEEETR